MVGVFSRCGLCVTFILFIGGMLVVGADVDEVICDYKGYQ